MGFFFQAEDGIRDATVTGVQTCALPICAAAVRGMERATGARGGLVRPSAPRTAQFFSEAARGRLDDRGAVSGNAEEPIDGRVDPPSRGRRRALLPATRRGHARALRRPLRRSWHPAT